MRSPAVYESATSRALSCPDIILEIVEQTYPLSDSPRVSVDHDRNLLSILALVCKTFNGPATKTLWSRLDSFLPLLAILSAFDHRNTNGDFAPTYVRRYNVIFSLVMSPLLTLVRR